MLQRVHYPYQFFVISYHSHKVMIQIMYPLRHTLDSIVLFRPINHFFLKGLLSLGHSKVATPSRLYFPCELFLFVLLCSTDKYEYAFMIKVERYATI